MRALKEWFLKEQRDLPWRQDRAPYRVWISEVMLQQTQVAVVIPYFHRWMQKFPTLESLAQATEEEVIKQWEGLGYYSRARNLHKAARLILEKHGGIIPSQPEELEELPGFGPYTVGAVLSFAFGKKAPAVDGNVVRVLSRYFASSQDSSQKTHYEQLTLSVLPDEEPWVVMEALIELGAQICRRNPHCSECPLLEKCQAHRQGRVLEFPSPRERPPTIQLKRRVAIIRSGEKILVRQEKGGKVMSGLYEFPYATDPEPFSFEEPLPNDRGDSSRFKEAGHLNTISAPMAEVRLESPLKGQGYDERIIQISLKKVVDFSIVKHGFTRYDVTLFPTLYETEDEASIPGYEWRLKETLQQLPFSSGHRRILGMINAYFAH